MTAPGKYLSTNDENGTSLGQSASELISFYGSAGVAQQTLAANGTDAATTQALANDLKAKLKALGLCK